MTLLGDSFFPKVLSTPFNWLLDRSMVLMLGRLAREEGASSGGEGEGEGEEEWGVGERVQKRGGGKGAWSLERGKWSGKAWGSMTQNST